MNKIPEYLDLVNDLNNIANTEDSIEMPAITYQFSLEIGEDYFSLKTCNTEIFECFKDKDFTEKQIIEEAIEHLTNEIDAMIFSRDICKFYLSRGAE